MYCAFCVCVCKCIFFERFTTALLLLLLLLLLMLLLVLLCQVLFGVVLNLIYHRSDAAVCAAFHCCDALACDVQGMSLVHKAGLPSQKF